MSKVFTRRALNRATLQRQMLLRREDVTAAEAVERLAGLNAQDPRPPYLSLWARLAGFELDDLTKLLYDRSVIRSSMMRVLYDLPDAPRPDPDTPAPVRFLPEVDNLLTGHADRTRIMTTEVRQQVCIGAVIKATVLVDGFVHGIWSIKREGGRATLEIELFHKVDPAILEEEGMRLLAFAASDTGEHDILVS